MTQAAVRSKRRLLQAQTGPQAQLERLEGLVPSAAFNASLRTHGLSPLRADAVSWLQINVGKVCNQTCAHCHVDAGPHRTEQMSADVFAASVRLGEALGVSQLDITGGAPELHPDFCDMVRAGRKRGWHVIDRCNLTVLELPRFRDMAAFLAENDVEIVASLPHYRRLLTDAQRGDGVFEASISAMRKLNALGYGQGRPDRILTLVANPAGAYLPGDQGALEREWKQGLQAHHGVSFDRLYVITNMPISRYLEWLDEKHQLERYMRTLVDAFNPATVGGLMCRSLISVGWDGSLYDCDFNQMLELPTTPDNVLQVDPATLAGRAVRVAAHCYGCTAGPGSSCGGSTTVG